MENFYNFLPSIFACLVIILLLLAVLFMLALILMSSDIKENATNELIQSLSKHAANMLGHEEAISTLQSQMRLCSNRIKLFHQCENDLKKEFKSGGSIDDLVFNELLKVKDQIKREVKLKFLLKSQYRELINSYYC